jgi:hypothetical protein
LYVLNPILKMKKLIFLIISVMLITVNSCITDTKQQATEIFSEYEGQSGFVIFRVPPALLRMFIKSDSTTDKKLIEKLDIIQVVIFAENENSARYSEVNKKVNDKITLSDFNLISNISQEQKNINIFAIHKETQIKEILLMITGGDEIIAIDFVGDMSIEDVIKLANKIDEENIKNFTINE